MSDPLTRSELSLWRDLWPYLRKDLGLYSVALLLAPATALLVVLQPWLLKSIVDTHIVPGDAAGLGTAVAIYGVAVVAGFLLQTGHTLALSYASMRSITRLRRAVVDHTLTRGQRFFDSQPTGRLLTRATSDVDALGETLTAGAITIVLDALQVVGVVVAMVWLDAGLTLVLLLVGPPLVLVVEYLRRRLRTLYLEVRNTLSDLNAYLSERLDGLVVLQLYGDEARAQAAHDERLARYTHATVRTNVYDALMYATVDGLGSVTLALMLFYGASGGLWGAVTAGTLAAFIDYVARLFRPIQEFSAKVSVIQRASAALNKIFGLLDVDETVARGTATLTEPVGDVRMTGVTFAYREGEPVVHNIDLHLAPGETVALVGRTGSGKTTLTRLLWRAYDGYDGAITLDGVPLSTLTDEALRSVVGVVLQDVQLFPGDVRFNLTLGMNHPDTGIETAVQRARATQVVARLGGLNGMIEEGGRNLSGGEAQLLAFARVLLRDPVVIVLDEATASIDSATEAALQEATTEVLAGRTTLVVAHRLSTVVDADRIVVMDQGRIIEQGKHAALLAANGAYAALFRAQFVERTADAVIEG